MKYVILFLLIIIIFAISITLGASNDQIVSFNYLLAKTDLRLSTLLALLFGTGFLVGWLLTGVFLLRMKLSLTATRRKLNKLQKKYDEETATNQKTQLTTIN